MDTISIIFGCISALLILVGVVVLFMDDPRATVGPSLFVIAAGILAFFIATDREALGNAIRDELLSWSLAVFIGTVVAGIIYTKLSS